MDGRGFHIRYSTCFEIHKERLERNIFYFWVIAISHLFLQMVYLIRELE